MDHFNGGGSAGDTALGSTLLCEAVAGAARSRTFLALLAQSTEQTAPNLGFFGRPRLADGRQDLKRDGLLPLVGFARAVALRAGSAARTTPDRIADAVTAGRISEGDARILTAIHGRLLTWILHQQLADLRDGIRVSSNVVLKTLSKADRKQLKSDLRDLKSIAEGVRSLMS